MKLIPLIALVLGATPAWAGRTPVTEGMLQARDGNEVIAVPLEHTEVTVRIDGFIADVEVAQKFHNPYKHKIEALYLFPLPARSAVNGYELVTGGRTIKGEIKLKEDAKTIYKAARTKGFVAALLTQERPNLFTQSVANIEPDATVEVHLHYVHALTYDDGAYELVFPMVAGPRFVPKADAAAVQPAVLPAGTRSAHDIAVSVEVDAGVPIRNVRSPSHRIETATGSPHEANIKLAAGNTIPNKDFVLRYDVAGEHRPAFAVVPHRAGDGGAFFFMAQPPVHAEVAEVTPKEMVFVIDTSSSMQGRPLDKAKEAIARALQTMHPDDTFQIVRFDDTASALGARPVANKPKNVERALAWLGQLQVGGGTDMTTGIRAALAFPHDRARLRIVVFLTDGFIGNEDEILALVQEHLGDSRLFSFGVGSAVNRYLLEEMAALGRGTVQIVRPDEDTAVAVGRLERRIGSPLLTDIAIDWKGLAVADVGPARIPDLFAGQPLVLSGRYTRPGTATVTVTGKLAGRAVSFDVPVSLPDRRDRPAIAAIWARDRIAELARRQLRAEQPAVKQQIIDLALAHHLMSAYTAFVAVDTSRATGGGAPQQVAVPVEVPDGLRSTRGDYGGSGNGNIYGIEAGPVGGAGEYAAPGKPTLDSHSLGVTGDGESRAEARMTVSAPVPPPPMPPVPSMAKPAPTPFEPKQHAKKGEDPAARTAVAETSDAAMRADLGRCFAGDAHATVQVAVDFDRAGATASVAVTGTSDPALTACVRSAAKKWRSNRSHVGIGFTH